MKRFTAIVLSMVLLLSFRITSLADSETDTYSGDFEKQIENDEDFAEADKNTINGIYNPNIYNTPFDPYLVNDTDIMEADWKYTEYIYRERLEKYKQKILEDAYLLLSNCIDQRDGAMSVYWAESELLPMIIVIKVRNFDRVSSYTFLEYTEEDKWQEMEHEIDEKNKTVTITVKNTGPIAICYSPGGTGAIMEALKEQTKVFNSVTGKMQERDGIKATSIPPHIHTEEDVVVVPVDLASDLSEMDWRVFKDGYDQLKDQIPEGMTARYYFWLMVEEPGEVDFTMKDVKQGDTVLCKQYNGSWKELPVKIKEDGKVTVFFADSGAVAILTEIEKEPE